MQYEVNQTRAAVLVEPGDEKGDIVRWLARQRKPVVMILPEQDTIRRPGDLLELRRISAQQQNTLNLVISSNERLRQWARRQGFNVFSSLEACSRATQRDTEPLAYTQHELIPSMKLASGSLKHRVELTKNTTARRRSGDLSAQLREQKEHERRQSRLLWFLIALLALGILGGIGFGYLMTVAEAGHVTPVVFSYLVMNA
ncbi:hypothetical protein [Tengunoibacter tsumagoiensis]|uniref:Uncharacterized protein n=1 Tax=Tengunoibacter tsumagoiensis TaxID=2014871 RepID=A0A401ZXE2_9CHLR|nr:hypothetical protein [Tengunoibacter tsumagoiensis]GCE11520.1 hypothetical protein KTT_13790 [Tengunoibacter tsumagoiensis]